MAGGDHGAARPSTRRRLAFSMALVLLTGAVLEGLSYATHCLYYGATFSYAATARRQAQLTRPQPAQGAEGYHPAGDLAPKVIHPYVGYVSLPDHVPRDLSKQGFTSADCVTNSLGFLGRATLPRRSSGKLIVVIAGGSVANQFFCASAERLAARLRSIPRYAGREVQLIGFAAEGYKQPQQLMALSYYLVLGGELDLLINLAGYNEIESSRLLETLKINPIYPDGWHVNFNSMLDRLTLQQVGQIAVARRARARLAAAASRLRWSVTASTLWSLADELLERQVKRGNLRLSRAASEKQYRYSRNGPRISGAAGAPLHAATWYRSALQMAALARASGFSYFELLQPNQHVAGSKPLSRQESAHALPAGHKTRQELTRLVDGGYRLLRAYAPQLRRQGVAFHDLSQAFKQEHETLYIDGCCHLNQRGYDLLADAMGKIVASQLPAQP